MTTLTVLIGMVLGVVVGVPVGYFGLRLRNTWCPQCGSTTRCPTCPEHPTAVQAHLARAKQTFTSYADLAAASSGHRAPASASTRPAGSDR